MCRCKLNLFINRQKKLLRRCDHVRGFHNSTTGITCSERRVNAGVQTQHRRSGQPQVRVMGSDGRLHNSRVGDDAGALAAGARLHRSQSRIGSGWGAQGMGYRHNGLFFDDTGGTLRADGTSRKRRRRISDNDANNSNSSSSSVRGISNSGNMYRGDSSSSGTSYRDEVGAGRQTQQWEE
jgi:hypothetical protein